MSELDIVGVDLGTTYSSLALLNDLGKPEIIPNEEGEKLTPSVVLFDNDSTFVGRVAKDAAVTNPENVVAFVKRQMGNPNWRFDYRGHSYSPMEISAKILAYLKVSAEKYVGRMLPYAVISVPAYYDDDRRRATISAGELAGFKVLDLINEPTAAAIAYGMNQTTSGNVLVYDLGGGTFDVTLLHLDGKNIRVLATDGDHQLGGKDFDDTIIRVVTEKFINQHSFDPSEDAFVLSDLRAQAERAKRELSVRAESRIVVRAQGRIVIVNLTRERFETSIKPRIETTMHLIRSVLGDANLTNKDISRILLVGGSTRIPFVRKQLEQFFGTAPDTTLNPDESVALGAAIVAAQKYIEFSPKSVSRVIEEKIGALQITDVTSHSIGIEASLPQTNQRINSIIIQRNSPIPISVSKEFVTTLHGQTAIRVNIYQGEFSDIQLCNPIGEFVLSNLPPNRPAGRKVLVTISISTQGIVNVTAIDVETTIQVAVQISYKDEYNLVEQTTANKYSLQGPKHLVLPTKHPATKTVLFLAADPADTSRLRLGEELREIQEKLQMAKLREQFELQQRTSVRPADISQAFLDLMPQIVHFSGHGTSAGALCFENQLGTTHLVEPDALAALFEQFEQEVECVLLNACYSEAQAKAISRHIQYVIGMDKAIGDESAIAFSIGFYQAIGAGKTFEEAYKLGCIQIMLQGIHENVKPVLLKKVNAA